MKRFKIKLYNGDTRTEKVVEASSYAEATRLYDNLPPGYIWSCEPMG